METLQADLDKIYFTPSNIKPKLRNTDKEYNYQESYNSCNTSYSIYPNFKTTIKQSINNCNQSIVCEKSNDNFEIKSGYCDTWLHNVNTEEYLKPKFPEQTVIKNEILIEEDQINLQSNDKIKFDNEHLNYNKGLLDEQVSYKMKNPLSILFKKNCNERMARLLKEATVYKQAEQHYESLEHKRKRLDADADRKRKYRLYIESPEQRRKRLDKDAERRRMKRLTLYANETEDERRQRLNRESAKKRIARMIKYAKETTEERKDRLRKDALRAKELRFARSVIETEEERKERLIKEALKKKELRIKENMSQKTSEVNSENNIEKLKTVRDIQFENQYLNNWTVWFQNSLSQSVTMDERCTKITSCGDK